MLFASKLTERNVRPSLVGVERRDQCGQVPFKPCERAGVQTRKCLRQYAGERTWGASQDPAAGGSDTQLHGTAIWTVLGSRDQIALDQRLDQIAGRRLVDIHGPGQVVDTDSRTVSDDAQRPELRASDAGLLLDLLEMSLDGIEDEAEPAQNPRSGFADLTAGWTRWCRSRGAGCCLGFGHGRMI